MAHKGGSSMWLEVEFIPTSLFSFKDINATNTAATSLLIPTPFAVKMALISNCIQKYDIDKARDFYSIIKDRIIKYQLPEEIVVNKTFGRINDLREKRGRSKPGYREYVYAKGVLKIAVEISGMDESQQNNLKTLFMRVNYFGKKGSFVQFKSYKIIDELDDAYINIMGRDNFIAGQSIIQFAEDVPKDSTFDQINIYDSDNNLKRENNKIMYMVNIDRALSGDGYQYYHISQ